MVRSGTGTTTWFAASAAAIMVVYAASAGAQPSPGARSLAALEAAAGPLKVTRSRATGLATFVRPLSPRGIAVAAAPGANGEARARAFVATAGAIFGINGPDGVRLQRSAADEIGVEHVRFEQAQRGVPVRGGELIVHLRGSAVLAANGRTLPDIDGVDTSAAVPSARAQAAAHSLVTKTLGVANATLSTPRLEIINPGFLAGSLTQTHLAWFIEATGPALRERIWVDAHDGSIVLHFSQLTEARDRQIFTANNTSSYPGTLIRSEGGPATGDSDADLAYDYAGDTYDYFLNEHGRDSYDNAGAQLISTVHYCEFGFCPYANAFWNGSQMVYGEGFSAADDVDAHELTHAVTEYSAGLDYCLQPGALNESFSDIFGETVDLSNTGGTDTSAVRWLLGEDIPGIGAIRNMMNPSEFDQPAKTSDPQFVCASSCDDDDNGGVHTNSGVPNHAYALMVDGGTYNGTTVTGIGLTKAGKIQYRALTQYLTANALFIDAYNALQQACTDLIGTAGITADDCLEVGKALDAVEMGGEICPICGDGSVAGSEECDDGNTTSGDGCDVNCTVTACGNGVVTDGEECDDGNTSDGDGCTSDCKLPPGCKLYVSSDVSKHIPDESSVSSTLNVSSAATVTDVAVIGLRGSHTYLSDLQFVLQSPAAVDVTIIDRQCGGDEDFFLDLSDDAPEPITCPATDGLVHQPSNPLSAFDTGPAGGTWTLTIYDLAADDEGQLDGWGLRICAIGCGNGYIEPGEQCDDGNIADGDCCSSTCQYEAGGNACSPAAQPCGSGVCDGAGACTNIDPVPVGSVCRPAAGECDTAEACDGVSTTCPADEFMAAGMACGNPADTSCTDPDTCDGAGVCQPNDADLFFPCTDDGNPCTSDECDGAGTCEHQPTFNLCDDNDPCTQLDLCDSGTCVGYDPIVCDDGNVCTADTCLPGGGCDFDPTPLTSCRTSQKATLILQSDGSAADKQLFKWTNGDPIALGELAYPMGTTEYALCIYSGTSTELVEQITVPPGIPQWRPVGVQGFKYKDSTGASQGATKLLLKGSTTPGKSKVLFKGRGANLPDPVLENLAMPVIAQVVNQDTGACVEAVFGSDDVKRSTDTLFKAKFP